MTTGAKRRASRSGSRSTSSKAGHSDWAWRRRIPVRIPAAVAAGVSAAIRPADTTAAGVAGSSPAAIADQCSTSTTSIRGGMSAGLSGTVRLSGTALEGDDDIGIGRGRPRRSRPRNSVDGTANGGDATIGIRQPQNCPPRQRRRAAAYGNYLGPSFAQPSMTVTQAGPSGTLHRQGHVWAECTGPTRAGWIRCADPTRAGCLDHHGPSLPQAGAQASAVCGCQPHSGRQQDHIDVADQGVQHLGCCIAGLVHEHPPVQRRPSLGHC